MGISFRHAFRLATAFIFAASLPACAGGEGLVPQTHGAPGSGIFDRASQRCEVSADAQIWYAVPAGDFSPIDVRQERCDAGNLHAFSTPPVPSWAKPNGPTRAIFVAASLQEVYSREGMQLLESIAAKHRVPMSWLIDDPLYLLDSNLYDAYHAHNGDDVEVSPRHRLVGRAKTSLDWYVPHVSVEGAGHERFPSAALRRYGEYGFWGITWNSHGVDGTQDEGAPWGAYCADPSSYKRPARDGSCDLVALEWTARDLTRAYLSGHEEYFSTDPDDLVQRAGFTAETGAAYARSIVDAYAAAGHSRPLVMMAQEESAESQGNGDAAILDAMYAQARSDGMQLETIAQAAADAKAFAASPRAVAFPFIAGGKNVASPVLGGRTLYPATIDYHDDRIGLTFLAGHAMPQRAFRYADDPVSVYDVPLAPLPASQWPALTQAVVSNGTIAFAFNAPVALRFGVALWSDPAALELSGPGVVPAGSAGAVLTFDLQPGANTFAVKCARCKSGTALPYST